MWKSGLLGCRLWVVGCPPVRNGTFGRVEIPGLLRAHARKDACWYVYNGLRSPHQLLFEYWQVLQDYLPDYFVIYAKILMN